MPTAVTRSRTVNVLLKPEKAAPYHRFFSLQMYVICDCEEDKDDDDEYDDYDEDENQEGQGLVPWWQLSLQSSLQLSSTESHLLKRSFPRNSL